MADLTYEIAWWAATDALKKDVKAYKHAADILAKHTPHPIFVGLSAEKGDFFLLVTWESSAAHQEFVKHPDFAAIFNDYAELFPPEGAAAVLGVVHTHLNADPIKVLGAPVVEHAFLTPNEGVSVDDLKNGLLSVEGKRVENTGVDLGAVVGTAEERPEQLVALVGWESVEAHHAYVAPGGPAAEFAPKMREMIKGVEIHHVSYTRLA